MNDKEVADLLRELRHVQGERHNELVAEVRAVRAEQAVQGKELAALKTKASLWGGVSGLAGGVGTVLAMLGFGGKTP